MMQYGLYTSDDGLINCALWISDDTFTVMGFTAPLARTPRRPKKLLVRKQVFANSVGHEIRLAMPTIIAPYNFPGPVTIRGDATYVPTGVLGEINRGEAT